MASTSCSTPDLPTGGCTAAHVDHDRTVTPAVEIVDVARRFGDIDALAGVDLRVEPGEFFGLLGPNGAGKTTLISVLAGLTRADRGSARVLGHDVVERLPQGATYARRRPAGTRLRSVFHRARDPADPGGLLRPVAGTTTGSTKSCITSDSHSRANANMRALSGGMKRRVLVGQALVHKPPVIVLDEPTAGVDVELRQSLWAFIRKLNRDGHTIILTTHYLEEAEALCDRIAMLKAGTGRRARHDAEPAVDVSPGLTVRLTAPTLPRGWRRARSAARRRALTCCTLAELRRARAPARGVARARHRRSPSLSLQEADLEQVFLRIMKRAA